MKKKLRILHLTEALGGGVLNIVQQLSEAQSSAGHEVIVAHSNRTDTPKDNQLENFFPPPIKRIVVRIETEISFLKDIKSLIEILNIIKRNAPDIIHLHSSKAGVLGRIACLLTGRRKSCFYTPHGYSFLRKDISPARREIFRLIEKFSSYFGGTTIACSQSELDHSLRSVGHSQSLLVENSVPLAKIEQAIGSNGEHCVVSTSARLCYQKAPSAFRDLALKLQNDSARLLWIGGGELENELLADGVLPENMSFTGWVSREQVAGFLRTSDLFVMTSLWEGMPLSLLEAQAAGLPAVVPDVEGCRDVVIDGLTGFVCKNADDMAIKIKRLIDDAELRRKMGKTAREQALLRFAPERMHREIMQVYASTNKCST